MLKRLIFLVLLVSTLTNAVNAVVDVPSFKNANEYLYILVHGNVSNGYDTWAHGQNMQGQSFYDYLTKTLGLDGKVFFFSTMDNRGPNDFNFRQFKDPTWKPASNKTPVIVNGKTYVEEPWYKARLAEIKKKYGNALENNKYDGFEYSAPQTKLWVSFGSGRSPIV